MPRQPSLLCGFLSLQLKGCDTKAVIIMFVFNYLLQKINTDVTCSELRNMVFLCVLFHASIIILWISFSNSVYRVHSQKKWSNLWGKNKLASDGITTHLIFSYFKMGGGKQHSRSACKACLLDCYRFLSERIQLCVYKELPSLLSPWSWVLHFHGSCNKYFVHRRKKWWGGEKGKDSL